MVQQILFTTRAREAQGTPTQSHTSPCILVYEDQSGEVRSVLAKRCTQLSCGGRDQTKSSGTKLDCVLFIYIYIYVYILYTYTSQRTPDGGVCAEKYIYNVYVYI